MPQSYKNLNTHAHEILGYKILSRLIHLRASHIVGMNGDVQSDLVTLAFKNREQLEDFHSRILRLQQEIILCVETHQKKKNSPKAQDLTTVVPSNKRGPPLKGGHYTTVGGMWILKHETISKRFMSSSSKHNSNETSLWTSITTTITSRCVSMW